MEIFRLIPKERSQFLAPRTPGDGAVLTTLADGAMPNVVPPVSVKLVRENLGNSLDRTDFPWLASNVPAYSAEAVGRLGPLLAEAGQLFKLPCDEGDFFGLAVRTTLDALDPEKSLISRFSSGRIMEIKVHSFRADRLGDYPMFHLSGMRRGGWTYATGRYVDAVRQTKLPGADFELVWSSATDETRPRLA